MCVWERGYLRAFLCLSVCLSVSTYDGVWLLFCMCMFRQRSFPQRQAPVPRHSERLPTRAEWINKVIWKKGSSFPGIDFRQDELLCNVCLPLHFLFVPHNQGPLKFTVNCWWTILLWCMITFSLKSQNPAGKRLDFSFFQISCKTPSETN